MASWIFTSHLPSEIILICWFGAQESFLRLSMLKKVVVLNFFVETVIRFFFQDSLMNRNLKSSIYLTFYNIIININIFSVTFDQFSPSLLGKSINIFKIKLKLLKLRPLNNKFIILNILIFALNQILIFIHISVNLFMCHVCRWRLIVESAWQRISCMKRFTRSSMLWNKPSPSQRAQQGNEGTNV